MLCLPRAGYDAAPSSEVFVLDVAELRALTAWCRERALSWSPLQGDAGDDVMMLDPGVSRPGAKRMFLFQREGEFRLEDARGEVLAMASDLTAVLDAVDGGVGEARRAAPRSGFADTAPTPLQGFIF